MGLSKQEKLKIKQDYNKEWNNYLKRVRTAESKGIVIPESLLFTKVKNPTERSIERLKTANLNSFRRQSTANYVDQYGTIVSKDEAVTTVEKAKFKPWLGSTVRERNRTQQDSAPVTFEEYAKIAEETADIRQKFDLSDPVQKATYDDIVLSRIRKIRGPFFNEELFLANEEKNHGYFGRDPNRALDEEEREYIKNKLRERDVDVDDPYSYIKEVEKLRSPLSFYEPELQMYREELAKEPIFIDDVIFENEPEESETEDWKYKGIDKPEELPEPKKKEISSILYETYAYNALYSLVSELVLSSKYAQRNQTYLLNQLQILASIYDPRPLNEAVRQIAGENGELFDVEMLYKTGQLAQFLYRLERLMARLTMADENWTKEREDEAEANFNEAQEVIDEIDI